MAVVTHGSFDEGPIVLALPPIFEGLLPEGIATETDPIFMAWDRSTGISIYKNQIVDRGDLALTTDLADYVTINNLETILGGTYGDESLTDIIAGNYVPYSGATGNVDLGSNSLIVESVTINASPSAATDAATKGYVDDVVEFGLENPSFNLAHNDTTDKEGGGGGHWYHLSDTANTVIPNITESGSDIVPLDLTISDSGISDGRDGLAWVELTWTAIASDTFDHYVIEYKKSAYTYYTQLTATSNTIVIEGLTPNTSYDFRIASVNRYGTVSDFSTVVTDDTPADGVAPATVVGVSATSAVKAVLLRWTHNTDLDLASYNIYRYTSDTSASSVIIANYTGNVYMDNGLAVDTEYFYWLKAVDSSGNESDNFSTTVSATTSKLAASDLENIAANQVIIQGVTTLANWISPGVTTIDGSNITTGTITLTQLNFTPITGSNIVASINASPEGIQIDADNFAISGSSVFTAKVGGSFTSANSVPRIRIFPDVDTAIEIVDDLAHNVFKAYVGGTLLGDVIIGNWAGNTGIYYDKSANSTSFAGTIFAAAGTIGGWTIMPTYLVKDTGSTATSSGMSPGDYPFYAGSSYAGRASAPFRVSSGGVLDATVASFANLSNYTVIRSFTGGSLTNSNITDDGKVSINTSTGMVMPRLNSAPGTPEAGMIYYNTTNGHFYGYTNAWYALM